MPKKSSAKQRDPSPPRGLPASLRLGTLLKKHSTLHARPVKSLSSSQSAAGGSAEEERDERLKKFLVVQSSLTPTLGDILKNDLILPYFIQFLQECNQAQFVYFWLAAETFRLADKSASLPPDIAKGDEDDDACILTPDSENPPLEIPPTPHEIDEELLDVAETFANPFTDDGPSPVTEDRETDDFGRFQLSTDKNSVTLFTDFSSEDAGVTGGEFLKQYAVNIFTRYICKDSTQPIKVPDNIRKNTLDQICGEEGVNPTCFSDAQNYVYTVLLNRHYQPFLSSLFFVTYQLDRVTCRNVTFADVVYCDVTSAHLMEYLELAGLINILKCFFSLQNFKLNYDQKSGRDDAGIIFNQFFNSESRLFLPFPEKVIYDLETKMVGSNVTSNSFDIPFNILGDILVQDIFPHFLKSRFYRQVKTGLELSYFSLKNARKSKKKSNGPDTGGENEGETLLKGSQLQEMYEFTPDYDNLFVSPSKQNTKAKSCLGVVNAVGDYESHYESVPEKKDAKVSVKTKLFGFLKRQDDGYRAEAWVTAQKIVNEVNRETLSNIPASANGGLS